MGTLLAKVEKNSFKDENRAGGSEDGERLAGEDAVDDAAEESGTQRLHSTQSVLCGVAEQSSERD